MVKKANPSISSRKSPSQARSTQLVSDILEAAIQVLMEEGAEAFTTSRVAERAGVSVGSLYQYFPNKAALLFRLQTDEWSQNGLRLRDILMDPSAPPIERLRRFVHAFVRSECEEIELRHALGDAAPDYREEEPREARVEGTEVLEAFLREAFPGSSPETRALAGDMIMLTLNQVGKAISERRFSPELTDRYAAELADMLGGYLERRAREGRPSLPNE